MARVGFATLYLFIQRLSTASDEPREAYSADASEACSA